MTKSDADSGHGRLRQAVQDSRRLWLSDCSKLLNHAQDRFADVGWHSDSPIYAHKAILYARSTNAFLQRFLPRSTQAMYDDSACSSNISLTPNGYNDRPMTPASLHSPQMPGHFNLLPIELVDATLLKPLLEFIYTADTKGTSSEAFHFFLDDQSSSLFTRQDQAEPDLSPVDRLSQDLLFMWRSRLYADVQIELLVENVPHSSNHSSASLVESTDPSSEDAMTINEDSSTTIFIAHRMVLARVPYFAAFLLRSKTSPGYSDADTRFLTLPSPPFTPASLHFTLGYIYCGSLSFSARSFDLTTAFAIWRSAVYLGLDTLKTEIEARMHDMAFLTPPVQKQPNAKRCARIYAWSLSPDVNCTQLSSECRSVVVSLFGEAWQESVGLLDQDIQQKLVNDVCASLTPGALIDSLKQLVHAREVARKAALTRKSIDWADNILAMLDPVEAQIKRLLAERTQEVAQSAPFVSLLSGRSFSIGDILTEALRMLQDNLIEKTAALSYQAIVGDVLLREDGIQMDARMLVEDCRQAILKFLKLRWVNVRQQKGFNELQSWALKEIADELEMRPDDLLYHEAVATHPSSPGLRKLSSNTTLMRKKMDKGDVRDEQGSISLRASTIQRNAALKIRPARKSDAPSASDSKSVKSTASAPGIAPRKTPIDTSPKQPLASRRPSTTSVASTSSMSKPVLKDASPKPACATVSKPPPLNLRKMSDTASVKSRPTTSRSRATSNASRTSTATTVRSTRDLPTSRPATPKTPKTASITSIRSQSSIMAPFDEQNARVRSVSRSSLRSTSTKASVASTKTKPKGGTSLNVGIKCVVSFQRRRKATGNVLYLGPVPAMGPGQWIGVEVDTTEAAELLTARDIDWNDGQIGGVRYFEPVGKKARDKKPRGVFVRPSQVMFLF